MNVWDMIEFGYGKEILDEIKSSLFLYKYTQFIERNNNNNNNKELKFDNSNQALTYIALRKTYEIHFKGTVEERKNNASIPSEDSKPKAKEDKYAQLGKAPDNTNNMKETKKRTIPNKPNNMSANKQPKR